MEKYEPEKCKPVTARCKAVGEDEAAEKVIEIFTKLRGTLTDHIKAIIRCGVVGRWFRIKELEDHSKGVDSRGYSLGSSDKRHKKMQQAETYAKKLMFLLDELRKDEFTYAAMENFIDFADFEQYGNILLKISAAAFHGRRYSLYAYKKGDNEREMVHAVQGVYEEVTGEKARDGVRHDRMNERYYGEFHELLEEVFKVLNITLPTGGTIQKYTGRHSD